MEFPSAINVLCSNCNTETLHKVLKGRLGKNKQLTLDCTIKCSDCGFIHQATITEKKLISVHVIMSILDKSKQTSIELHPDEELLVGQELILDEQNVVITSLEVNNTRVEHATGKDVNTIWTKATEFDGKVKVKVSAQKGANTLSHTIDALPDEEFFIGDILRLGRVKVAIYKIKTQTSVVKYDSAVARDIVRIYGRVIR